MRAGDVHLWCVELDDARWDGLEWVLDSSERGRAMQFLSDALQWRARRCRSALRCILGHHVGQSPSALQLHADRFGKPQLGGFALHFNVSHTEGWALIAVAGAPVGVDVEPMVRPTIGVEEIAELLCHPAEKTDLLALAGLAGNAAMMRLWTQKEAYVKALGTGLQHGLPSVRMIPSLRPGIALVVDETPGMDTPYFTHAIEAPPQCVASLCTAAPDAQISRFDASILLQAASGHQQA